MLRTIESARLADLPADVVVDEPEAASERHFAAATVDI